MAAGQQVMGSAAAEARAGPQADWVERVARDAREAMAVATAT